MAKITNKEKNNTKTTKVDDSLTIIKTSKKEDSITEQQLYDVLQFAQSAYSGAFPNVFTPQMVNERMKDLNLNPLVSDEAKIQSALAQPKQNEELLIGYGEFFELSNMLYKRMLSYTSNILSFDIKDIICTNAEESDYSSKKYKEDYKSACDFLDKFNIKEEFLKVMRECLRNDASFWVLRNEGKKYVLQELPQKYCLITGRWDYGILFDMNMTWFLQAGVDINMYPDSLKRMYLDTFYDADGHYNPSSTMAQRDGTYALYAQTSPKEGFWAWKLTPEIATRIPYLAPLFNDIAMQPLMRNLQKNKNIIEATKLAVGLIPLLDKSAKGQVVSDMVAIDPDTAGKFLALLKSGISDSIKIGALPFEDMKAIDFKTTDNNILSESNQNIGTSAFSTKLVYSDARQTILETGIAFDADVAIVHYMYNYFESFLEYFINKTTKNFHFKIHLDGTMATHEKATRMQEFTTLAALGVVLPNRLSYALGMMPHELKKSMEEAKSSGFIELLLPMMNLFTGNTGAEESKDVKDTEKKPVETTSKKNVAVSKNKANNSGGRPPKADGDLKDGGATARDYK